MHHQRRRCRAGNEDEDQALARAEASHAGEKAALLAHLQRRERRVYEALLMLLSVRDEKLVRSFAILLDFVVGLAERGPRR